jgi:hypothetical protein
MEEVDWLAAWKGPAGFSVEKSPPPVGLTGLVNNIDGAFGLNGVGAGELPKIEGVFDGASVGFCGAANVSGCTKGCLCRLYWP